MTFPRRSIVHGHTALERRAVMKRAPAGPSAYRKRKRSRWRFSCDYPAFDGAFAPELENRALQAIRQGVGTGPAGEIGGVRANHSIGTVVAALIAFLFHDGR